jgi:hypothetical protein
VLRQRRIAVARSHSEQNLSNYSVVAFGGYNCAALGFMDLVELCSSTGTIVLAGQQANIARDLASIHPKPLLFETTDERIGNAGTLRDAEPELIDRQIDSD